MTVYHGSTEIIKNPDVLHSYRPLDFGKGFYVTSNKEQAKVWAKRKGVILESKKSIVNIFEMNENFSFLQCKNFGELDLKYLQSGSLPLLNQYR